MSRVDPQRTPEFIRLLTGSQSRLYGYILSLVADVDHANDVLQQTNSILWQKKAEFQLGSNFIAWSFRIAYFQVLAHRKKCQRDKLAFGDDLLSEVAEVAGELDETYEARQRQLRICLERLNSRQRDVIRRRYYAGSNLDVMASDMGMRVNAVKQLLFRARNALSKCIEAALPTEVAS